jgi:serine/threonine protein kinase
MAQPSLRISLPSSGAPVSGASTAPAAVLPNSVAGFASSSTPSSSSSPAGRAGTGTGPSHPSSSGGAGRPAGPPLNVLRFSPMPGRLPEVIFVPVLQALISIGGAAPVPAFFPYYPAGGAGAGAGAGASGAGAAPPPPLALVAAAAPSIPSQCGWVLVKELSRTQQGRVLVVAQTKRGGRDGAHYYVTEGGQYVLRALKQEGKARVAAAQERLSHGDHRDNSILERALLLDLGRSESRSRVVRLHECWHDDNHLYSLLEFEAGGDLYDRAVTFSPYRPRRRDDDEDDEDEEEEEEEEEGGEVAMAEGGPIPFTPGGSPIRALGVPESVARSVIRDVLLALRSLHLRGFAHRDVSPENILVRPRPAGPGGGGGMADDTDGDVDFGADDSRGGGRRGRGRGAGTDGITYEGVLIDFGSAMPMVQERTGAGDARGGGAGFVSPGPFDGRGTGGGATAASSSSSSSSSQATTAPVSPMPAYLLAPPVGGWEAMPPPSGAPFCKPAYACPQYMWGRPWYGVSYDIWSVGATLFAALDGKPLYTVPHVAEPKFALLLETDRAAVAAAGLPTASPSLLIGPMGTGGSGGGGGAGGGTAGGGGGGRHLQLPLSVPAPVTTGGAPSMPFGRPPTFEAYLMAYNAAERGPTSVGRRPRLSPSLLDLLSRLLRVTPAFRPLTIDAVLAHPWFREG